MLQHTWLVCSQTNVSDTAHIVWKYATNKFPFLGTSPNVQHHPSTQLGWMWCNHIYNDATFAFEHLKKCGCLKLVKSENWASVFSDFPLYIMQLMYSECVVHMQSDHMHSGIKFVSILNYDTIQPSTLVELEEYPNMENKDVPVSNIISLFHTNANIQ
jgi:hypothetical protein